MEAERELDQLYDLTATAADFLTNCGPGRPTATKTAALKSLQSNMAVSLLLACAVAWPTFCRHMLMNRCTKSDSFTRWPWQLSSEVVSFRPRFANVATFLLVVGHEEMMRICKTVVLHSLASGQKIALISVTRGDAVKCLERVPLTNGSGAVRGQTTSVRLRFYLPPEFHIESE